MNMKTLLISCLLGFSASLTFAGIKNYIADMTHYRPYIEVCFKDGKTMIDIHNLEGGTTVGGNCSPGNSGFVIERDERVVTEKGSRKKNVTWHDAVEACLRDNMRLPDIFEWQLACYNSVQWSPVMAEAMTDNWEWASGKEWPLVLNGNAGVAATILGQQGCNQGTYEWIAYYAGADSRAYFRCAR